MKPKKKTKNKKLAKKITVKKALKKKKAVRRRPRLWRGKVKKPKKVLVLKKKVKHKTKKKIQKKLNSRKKIKPSMKFRARKLKKKISKKIKKLGRSVKKLIIKKAAIKRRKKKVAFAKPAASRRKIKKPQKSESFTAGSFFKAKIKVIGIGGGGGSIVSEIGRSLHKASFVIADTDVRAFRKKAGIKYFLFGQELTHGLGTGLNTELAQAAAESESERIAKLFEDQDIVILIACLGGGLGSGATKVFAQALENFQGIVFGIFTLPFKFEGKNKQKIAYRALKELKKSLNVSITIPNERIFKIINSDTAITDAFSMVNKNLIESLESLIDLIFSPGIINIDFADLRAILRGKGNIAFLNTAESSGKDSAQRISEQILHNPLYQNNNFTADKILFNILGGGNLSMFEVDKISRAIAQQNPKAKIIFGISKNSNYKNKIKTTLLMTGQGAVAEVPVKKEKIEKPAVIAEENKISPVLKKVKKKAVQRKKKLIENKIKKTNEKELAPFINALPPVFTDALVDASDSRKLSIMENQENQKKAIRRSALEIKEAQTIEENKKSKQEEEWEIPAFLRKVHRN